MEAFGAAPVASHAPFEHRADREHALCGARLRRKDSRDDRFAPDAALCHVMRPDRRAFLGGTLAAAAALAGLGLLPTRRTPTASADTRRPHFAGSPYRRLVRDWTFGDTVRDVQDLFEEFHTTYIYEDGRLAFLNNAWSRMARADNHLIEDGVLKLVARVNRWEPGGLTSGMLRSREHFHVGYFECCAKVPHAPGSSHHQGFWLNPELRPDGSTAHWPPEFDFVEVVEAADGSSNEWISHHNLHGKRAVGRTLFSALEDVEWNRKFHAASLGRDFHIYGGVLTPERAIHVLDGQKVRETEFRLLHDDGVPAVGMHLLYDHVIGGTWPGNPRRRDLFPVTAEIKWIRVYQ